MTSPLQSQNPRIHDNCRAWVFGLLAGAIGWLGSFSTDAADRKTLLVLGDSIAAGYGLEPQQAFPALLQEKIDAAGWNVEVINGGVSGDTTAGGLRRINWMLKRPIDILVIELGGNDGLRGLSPDMTRTNLQAIIDRVREKNSRTSIVIAGMRMPDNMGSVYTKEFANVFPALAKANEVFLIPFLLESVGGVAGLNQADQIHPNAEGHRIVAGNVWKIIEPLLAKTPPVDHLKRTTAQETPAGKP
ncbi:MAG: arylesterase [Pedosphaera sp.]|nr:arylesterase [Pedosphaera sp.]